MIAKLIGILDFISDGYIILNVSGVGYRVFCSAKTLSKLPPINQVVSLFIETQVREDHIHLFGFSDVTEQQLFNCLTVVQGVGPKVGLAILSVLSVNEIKVAIMTNDSKAFTRVQGIGPKLGARLVTELKGKLSALGFNEQIPVLPSIQKSEDSKILGDTVSALVNLGYSRTEAGIASAKVLSTNPQASLTELIRLSLKEIGKANA